MHTRMGKEVLANGPAVTKGREGDQLGDQTQIDTHTHPHFPALHPLQPHEPRILEHLAEGWEDADEMGWMQVGRRRRR